MGTPQQHARFEHDDYDLRASLHSASPSALMASYSDFSMNFAQSQSQSFAPAFDRPQPTIKTSFASHRGSVGNRSDDNLSGSSAHPHRLSVGSPGNMAQDGNHTSP